MKSKYTKKTTINKNTKNKLTKLANFLLVKAIELEIEKQKWFDLSNWAEKGWPEKKCGTTACAMGWATAAFPRSQLRLITGPYYQGHELKYKNYQSFDAAAAFLGFQNNENADDIVCYLFSPDNYPRSRRDDARYVAKRILKFVEDGKYSTRIWW